MKSKCDWIPYRKSLLEKPQQFWKYFSCLNINEWKQKGWISCTEEELHEYIHISLLHTHNLRYDTYSFMKKHRLNSHWVIFFWQSMKLVSAQYSDLHRYILSKNQQWLYWHVIHVNTRLKLLSSEHHEIMFDLLGFP